MHKIMPRVGKEVITPDGAGTVLDNNVISETTSVKVQLADGTFEIKSYPFRELMTKAGKAFDQPCPCEDGCNCDGMACSANEEEQPSDENSDPKPETVPEASAPDDGGDGAGGDTL